MGDLLHKFSDPGGTTLDLFMGSGTTLCVARHLGWPAIGIEMDERYCELAARRLGQGELRLQESGPR